MYDLNTMSALYHIAQNEPPRLTRSHPVFPDVTRSEEMISFVEKCLKKDPSVRFSARESKQVGVYWVVDIPLRLGKPAARF